MKKNVKKRTVVSAKGVACKGRVMNVQQVSNKTGGGGVRAR